ncbi:hypothetical protein [Lentzea sp. NPDC051838]|uniref:hypothetical protein n=1 Tax=Lentzea sp. NPDC051838 TaxID=3154849 RepID=UPI0034360621
MWMLLAGLVIVLGCALTMTASAQPTVPSAPTPSSPVAPSTTRIPTPTSSLVCPPPQAGQPAPPGCLPQPTTQPSTSATTAPPTIPSTGSSGGECGFTNPTACVGEGINAFINRLVGESLNMLLRFVGSTLLSTPTLDQLPRIGEIWEQSRLLLVAVYSLLVLIAGIVVMSHGSLQSRQSIREVAPRIVIGFLAANLSLFVGDQAIRFANALSIAVLGDSLDPQTSGQAIAELFVTLVAQSLVDGGLLAGFLSLVLTILLVGLLIGYVVRVALTVVLLAGAPLALMCHGLEQTEGVAHWFWRAGAGVLGIQVGQSLALICALKLFLQPGGFAFFGMARPNGVVTLIVVIALVWILVKIPTWVMHQVRIGGGRRSFLGGLAYAFVFGKAMALLGARRFAMQTTAATASRGTGGGRSTPEPRWPAPIREWGGVGGIYTPEAIARRLQQQRTRELAQRRTVSGQQHLRFQQAAPQTPTHDIASWNPAGSTVEPEFRPPTPVSGRAEPLARPIGRPSVPEFRSAMRTASSAAPTPPRLRTAAVPAELQFRPAAPTPEVTPMRATGAPAPTVFRQAVPDLGGHGRRTRSQTPAPVQFQAPSRSPAPGNDASERGRRP